MKRILLGLAVLVVLGLIAGVLSLNSVVEAAVERAGTSALGVETELDGADVGLLSTAAQLDGLRIANPEGFSGEPFLALGSAGFDLHAASLLDDVVQIPSIELTGTRLRVEQSGAQSNVATLLAHLRGRGTGDGGGEQDGAGTGKRFLVERIVLREVQVDVVIDPLGTGLEPATATLVIPEVLVEDVGTAEAGAPLPEVVARVVEALLSATLEADGASILDGTLRKSIEDGLQGLESQGRDALEDARRRAEDAIQDAKEGLDGVLDGAKDGLEGKAGDALKGIGGGN